MSGFHRFRAMGCDVVAAGADPAAVEAVFDRYDRTFSRFRPESELNRVNAAAGTAVCVSPLFAAVLERALALAAATRGLVDPTVGAGLLSAGYDRDFALLDGGAAPAGPPRPGRLGEVRLAGRLLLVPAGVQLDLNGVVKAIAVDEAAALATAEGFVAAGGDLAVRGPTGVALPGGGSITVVSGGLATSGTTRRRWRRGGVEQHHLIDPRTGRPAASPWREVTASGATCVDADVAAKAAFLLGADGPAWLDEHSIPGRFVGRDGGVRENRTWSAATRELALCT